MMNKWLDPPFQTNFVDIMDTTDHLMGDTVSFSFDVADTEVLPESEVVMSSEEEESGIICQLMDIREPLLKLRSVLEQKLGCDLSDHDFWLQDQQPLKETMTLNAVSHVDDTDSIDSITNASAVRYISSISRNL